MNHSNTEGTAMSVVERHQIGGRDLILQANNLNAIVRVSEMMANSGQAVPRHLRKNAGACLAVTMQAMRWNMDPFALAQKTYTIDNDSPLAYEGQAIIAALNNSPLLTNRLSFEWGGPWEKIVGRFVWKESTKKTDDHGKPKKYLSKAWDDNEENGLWCKVTATLAGEREPRELQLFLMQARVRNSPLWVEDPRQQLAYLAARRWGRLHAPDVIMGVYTPDELAEPDEKYMGQADVVQPSATKPTQYSQADFDKNLPSWTKYIEAGKKTADEIIATVASKAPLSVEQQEKLRAIKSKVVDAETKPATTTATTEAGTVTYAALADRLTKCADTDAAALILDEGRALPADQQTDLGKLFAEKFGA